VVGAVRADRARVQQERRTLVREAVHRRGLQAPEQASRRP
jgi:hypothetical protein